ncbi:MAG: methyltransferase [Pseudomonadota bacterium]
MRRRLLRLVASRGFQRWAARFPLTRRATRAEGEAMMDVVAGFVHSQCLAAIIELDLLTRIMERDHTEASLAHALGVPPDRMAILVRAGEALNVLRAHRGIVLPTRRGAALSGVPGLADMIRHHGVLYRDLAKPAAFFRGETDPALARFWPYVFGAGAAKDPDAAARYSHLMAESQTLVAEDTLATRSLAGVRHLMDVGGGTGAFLSAALNADPALRGTLVDLPAVAPQAADRFAAADQTARVTIHPASFRDDPLPGGADAISLVRVLYDHADDTVAALLKSAFDALPAGGRLIVSEPMAGSRAGDVYFSIYTLAMQTGRTRSQEEIADLLSKAGFSNIRTPKSRRPFVTSVVTAVKA